MTCWVMATVSRKAKGWTDWEIAGMTRSKERVFGYKT